MAHPGMSREGIGLWITPGNSGDCGEREAGRTWVITKNQLRFRIDRRTNLDQTEDFTGIVLRIAYQLVSSEIRQGCLEK